jgi:hypothetical protein
MGCWLWVSDFFLAGSMLPSVKSENPLMLKALGTDD